MVTPVTSTLRAAIIGVSCRLWNEASSWRIKWTCTRCAGWPQASFAFALYWSILKSAKELTIRIQLVSFLPQDRRSTQLQHEWHLTPTFLLATGHKTITERTNKISQKNHKAWNCHTWCSSSIFKPQKKTVPWILWVEALKMCVSKSFTGYTDYGA
jgi:hypothetical protein